MEVNCMLPVKPNVIMQRGIQSKVLAVLNMHLI